MIIEITEHFVEIPVGMTFGFTFAQDHSCLKNKRISLLFFLLIVQLIWRKFSMLLQPVG